VARLRNDLYCVDWDVKLQNTVPMNVETVPQTVSIRHTFTHKKASLPKITWSYRGGGEPPLRPPLDPPLELIILELVHLVAYVMSHPARHGTITQKSTGVVDFLWLKLGFFSL